MEKLLKPCDGNSPTNSTEQLPQSNISLKIEKGKCYLFTSLTLMRKNRGFPQYFVKELTKKGEVLEGEIHLNSETGTLSYIFINGRVIVGLSGSIHKALYSYLLRYLKISEEVGRSVEDETRIKSFHAGDLKFNSEGELEYFNQRSGDFRVYVSTGCLTKGKYNKSFLGVNQLLDIFSLSKFILMFLTNLNLTIQKELQEKCKAYAKLNKTESSTDSIGDLSAVMQGKLQIKKLLNLVKEDQENVDGHLPLPLLLYWVKLEVYKFYPFYF
ncbi:hypothetical protein ACFL0U_01820 [Pseudomonadota bacterium]